MSESGEGYVCQDCGRTLEVDEGDIRCQSCYRKRREASYRKVEDFLKSNKITYQEVSDYYRQHLTLTITSTERLQEVDQLCQEAGIDLQDIGYWEDESDEITGAEEDARELQAELNYDPIQRLLDTAPPAMDEPGGADGKYG